MIDMNLANHV